MDGYNITPGFAKAPYHVESFPMGTGVFNTDGFNCLQVVRAPGAKFTSPEIAQHLADRWNSAVHATGGTQ